MRNDHWYTLTLAVMDYLAGGHRVQALSTLRHLRLASSRQVGRDFSAEYAQPRQSTRQPMGADLRTNKSFVELDANDVC